MSAAIYQKFFRKSGLAVSFYSALFGEDPKMKVFADSKFVRNDLITINGFAT
jgi:hypothetical protein